MNKILLDTHTWIWFMNGDSSIAGKKRDIINDAIHTSDVYIASISTWEVNMLAKKERITFSMPCLEWIKKGLASTRIQVIPLTPEIAIENCHLLGDFHGDPADRMIAASARIEGCTLLTRDRNIIKYSKDNYLSTLKI